MVLTPGTSDVPEFSKSFAESTPAPSRQFWARVAYVMGADAACAPDASSALTVMAYEVLLPNCEARKLVSVTSTGARPPTLTLYLSAPFAPGTGSQVTPKEFAFA